MTPHIMPYFYSIAQSQSEKSTAYKKSQSQRDFAATHPHVDNKLNTYKDETQLKPYCIRIGSLEARSDQAIRVNCNLFN